MAFQSYPCTATMLLPAETALSATEVGHGLHKITAGHLALPNTLVPLCIRAREAFGKPY